MPSIRSYVTTGFLLGMWFGLISRGYGELERVKHLLQAGDEIIGLLGGNIDQP